MEKTNKTGKKTVVQEVITNLSVAMVVVNLLGIAFVSNHSSSKMQEAESRYITEVVNNITSTVDTTMHEYIMVADVLALNTEVVRILESSSKATPMSRHESMPEVLQEMQKVLGKFEGSLELIALLSVAEDGFITETGITSEPGSTVTNQPYYEAVTKRSTIVTEPYLDTFSGGIMVSISAPVFDRSGQNVVGCIILDLSMGFLSDLISEFGNTGNTWVVDGNNSILAHQTVSLIGNDYSAAGVSGESFVRELANPTGSLIEYTREGQARTGSVGSVSRLGWKLIAGMDTDEFTTNSKELAVVLFTIQVICVVVSLVVCAVAVYQKLRPMKALNEAMYQMSTGNLNHDIDFESNNEIGELCANLRLTMSNLSVYIDEIKGNLSSFGDGDFTYESNIVFLGDFREIQTSTETFVQLITRTLNALKETVEQVSEGSGFVASGSQSLAEGSARQSGSIADLNVFIADITKQIQDNAISVDTANTTAQQISQELENSNSKMDEMMGAMNLINEKSEGITKIIKTIEDVAFQTNILALNAAVEAARAGTAGRGFAVVAEEVRNLSGRTNEAVKNTSDLIDETRTAIKDGNVIAESTIESLKSVTEEIVNFINTLDDIAKASQDQAVAIEKINTGVDEITSVMQTTSAVSEESAATSEELSSQASIMKDAIGQFRL